MLSSHSIFTTILLFVAGFCIVLGVLRPFSGDWLRYMWWRATGPEVQKGIVNTGDAKIRYYIVGSGRPVVLMHGGLSSSIDWYAQLPALAAQFQVVLIDQRGHGGSTMGTQPFSYSLHATDVIMVLDQLKLSVVDLVGWSDGGNIGLVLAKNHPQRVNQLVAISANAFPEGLTTTALNSIDELDPERPSLFARLLYHVQSPQPSRLGEMTAQVIHMWKSYPSLSLSDLTGIATPVLLIIGEEDAVSLKHAHSMKQSLVDSILVVAEKVGHNVPQAASKQVTNWLLEFL